MTAGLYAQQVQDEVQRAAEKFDDQQYDEVIAILEPVMDWPNVPEVAFQLLTSALLQLENIHEAQDWAESGVNRHERSLDLRLLEVEVMQQHNPQHAMQMMEEVIEEKEAGLLQSMRFSRQDLDNFKSGLHMLIGRGYIEQDRYDESITHFESAADLADDEPDVHRNLLYVYWQAGRFEELLERYERMPSPLQQDQQVMALRNQALLELEEIDELKQTYRRQYEQNPDDLESALIYGQLLIESGEILQANEHYNELLEKHSGERSIYDHLLELNRRQMNFEGVANLLDRMTEVFPEDEDLPFELADAYRMQGEKDEALAVYDSLIHAKGNEYEIARPRAVLLFEKSNKQQAYEDLKQSETILEAAQKQHDLGTLAYKKQDYEKALQHLESYLETNPTDTLALVLTGRSYDQTGEDAKAGDIYRQAVEIGAHWPEAHYHYFRNNPQELQEREKLLEAFSNTIDEIQDRQQQLALQAQFALRGQMIHEQSFYPSEEQFEDIRESFDRFYSFVFDEVDEDDTETILWELKDRHGDFGGVYEMAGDFYRYTGRDERALSVYKEGVQADPGNEYVITTIAEIKKNRGETEEAILWYERALNASDDPDLYSNLIRLHREAGSLDDLIDRWLIRYDSGRTDEAFREHLIEALHRAGRTREASEIARD